MSSQNAASALTHVGGPRYQAGIDDAVLDRLIARENEIYLSSIDLIAASNAPPEFVRDNRPWGVAQFRATEGIAGSRPYGGTGTFDAIERLAVERACDLFRANHANVQPLSGAIANLAAYRATLRPGSTILALSLEAGGHATHSHPRHVVTDTYRVVSFGVDPATERIDMEQARALALAERPHGIVVGATAYPRHIDYGAFAQIANEVGAVLIADIAHVAGLVAAGLHSNPCDFDAVTTLSVEKTLRGTRGGIILCRSQDAVAIDEAVFPGLQSSVGLATIVSLCAALADAASEPFRAYQTRTLSLAGAMAETLKSDGIDLVTGGTDTHMLIIDVGGIGLDGREAVQRLNEIGIFASPARLGAYRSQGGNRLGVRLGSAAIASRGFTEDEVRETCRLVIRTLRARSPSQRTVRRWRSEVRTLARRDRDCDTLRDLVRQPSTPRHGEQARHPA